VVTATDSTAGTPNPNELACNSQLNHNHCDIIATFNPRKLYESLLSFQLKSGGKKRCAIFLIPLIYLSLRVKHLLGKKAYLSVQKRSELKVLSLKVMINYRRVVNAEREIQ
jgi:hypothetical protein